MTTAVILVESNTPYMYSDKNKGEIKAHKTNVEELLRSTLYSNQSDEIFKVKKSGQAMRALVNKSTLSNKYHEMKVLPIIGVIVSFIGTMISIGTVKFLCMYIGNTEYITMDTSSYILVFLLFYVAFSLLTFSHLKKLKIVGVKKN